MVQTRTSGGPVVAAGGTTLDANRRKELAPSTHARFCRAAPWTAGGSTTLANSATAPLPTAMCRSAWWVSHRPWARSLDSLHHELACGDHGRRDAGVREQRTASSRCVGVALAVPDNVVQACAGTAVAMRAPTVSPAAEQRMSASSCSAVAVRDPIPTSDAAGRHPHQGP
jgi:hypothetical protein